MKHRTIVIDPPWPISMAGQNIKRPNQATKLPYPTMTIEEIENIPLDRIAATGCHVYLWTTNKFLKKSFNVLEHWGVNFHLVLPWIKHNGMTPCFAYKFASEYCLLGFYGKPMQPFVGAGKLNWIKTNMQKNHSAKPDDWFNLFEMMSPSPRLEMFARKKRDGWNVWGDEVKNDIEFEV